MLYVKETTANIDQVCKQLEESAAEQKYGVLGVHNLKEKMAAKGVEFGPECRVFEVCNPGKAKTVLESELSISTALPCRISVYQEGEKVKVATLTPPVLLAMFQRPELAPIAEEVETALFKIVDAACQGSDA